MLLQKIDGGEHFLHFVADDVPPNLERLPIDEFAMRLVGIRDVRAPREFVAAADKHRDRHQAIGLRQLLHKLNRFGESCAQPAEHLRRPIRIGQRHHAGTHCLGNQ